jgi:predicted helicase
LLFESPAEYGAKEPNLSPQFLEGLTRQYKRPPTPEEIFYYIYAILYSNTYRTKYAEFLKIDFPRVPFTKDYKLFKKVGGYGERLVSLHLLKSPELDPPMARFRGSGDNRVDRPRYESNSVYINQGQYFEGISQEVWSYYIGGYQVCEKWLKDRKGRTLSLNEIMHYCKIVTALEHTIKIQEKIDRVLGNIEETVLGN